MSDESEESFEEHLPSIIAHLQATSIALQYIQTETLRDLARTQPDPRKYLSNVFDRVVGRLENRPPEKWGRLDSSIQQSIERIFKHAGRGL